MVADEPSVHLRASSQDGNRFGGVAPVDDNTAQPATHAITQSVTKPALTHLGWSLALNMCGCRVSGVRYQ